jgi:hypothetical protein
MHDLKASFCEARSSVLRAPLDIYRRPVERAQALASLTIGSDVTRHPAAPRKQYAEGIDPAEPYPTAL